jgi:hypothetical protein
LIESAATEIDASRLKAGMRVADRFSATPHLPLMMLIGAAAMPLRVIMGE